MSHIRFTARSIPFTLFLLTVLTYGLMLPWTGFYWDDWPFAWIAKFLGPSEFFPAFEPFRPFLGPVFYATTSLLPPDPLLWQSLALLVRFALVLAAWWTFRTVWPKARWETLTAGLSFLVFPGYSQHWVAFTHINQEWIPFLFYLLSFGLTARAFRATGNSTPLTVLALGCMLVGIFPSEYFATQEPLRFLYLWALVSEEIPGFRARMRRVLHLWAPYLLVWTANVAWLVYYYRFGAYASYQVSAATGLQGPPVTILWGVLSAVGDAMWKAGLYSWVQIVFLAAGSLNNPSTLLTIAMIGVAFVLLACYLPRLDLPENRSRPIWGWQAVVFGSIGIMIGRIPSWAAGLPLTLGSINDRFMVSMMIGGSLFVAGLLDLAFGKRGWRGYLVALVIALGIGGQFYSANNFRRDWTRQQEIFWQLAWRIPGLQPGTVLLTHELPLSYETDMGLTAPLNWIYAPEYAGGQLPYALLYTRTRLDRVSLPTLEPGQPVTFDYRTVEFNGSTSRAVAIFVPPNACLRVLDSVYAGGATYERQPRFLRETIPLSDPGLILTDADPPDLPVALFGREPPHTWCYYYTKAELARQQEDWNRVASLGDEARAQGLLPGDALEWLPFIEAYLRTGDLESARDLSLLAYQDDSRPRKGLCYTWNRLRGSLGGDREIDSLASELREIFQCSP
jgi:hypothetical protein